MSRQIGPLSIPSFIEGGLPYLLYLVRAFEDYVKCTEGVLEDHLFYNSRFR